MNTKKNTIWIARHPLSDKQIKELIKKEGYSIVAHGPGRELGSRAINTEEDLDHYIADLNKLIEAHDLVALHGVFPAPVLGVMFDSMPLEPFAGFSSDRLIMVHQAWNTSRTPEGGKPTFEHKKFIPTGMYFLKKTGGVS